PEVQRILEALSEVGRRARRAEDDLRQHDGLAAYGKRVFTVLERARTEARTRAGDATGPLPEERVQQEMEQAWGALGVLYRTASKAVDAMTEAAGAAVEARDEATDRKGYAK